MKIKNFFVFLLLFSVFVNFSYSDWETIESGFDYQKFIEPGPTNVFVARMALDNDTSRTMDSMLAQGQLYKGDLSSPRETVSSMVNRHDDMINYYYQVWGQRNKIIAAVNGDYWEREYAGGPYTGRPTGGMVISGWFCRRFPEYSGGSGIFYTIWGAPHLGGDVINGGSSGCYQPITFNDGTTTNLTGINIERGSEALMLYTPQWDDNTHTDSSGIEVLVRVDKPCVPLPNGTSAYSTTGTIIEIRDGLSGTTIPFDHIVISGTGTYATTLRTKCVVGETLKVRTLIRDYGFDSRTPVHPPQDWTKAYGSIGVDRELLIDSIVTNLPSPDTTKRARTAVAFNADYLFLVVVEEQNNNGTYGMNFQELAVFCRDRLSATHATSIDGGGSSCMWIRGKGIVNNPSDGSERATVNGLALISVQGMRKSSKFEQGNLVRTTSSAYLRTGPGTNYQSLSTLSSGQTGTILSHGMNGIYAKGQYWWKWQSGSVVGWTSENSLQIAPPSETQSWNLY